MKKDEIDDYFTSLDWKPVKEFYLQNRLDMNGSAPFIFRGHRHTDPFSIKSGEEGIFGSPSLTLAADYGKIETLNKFLPKGIKLVSIFLAHNDQKFMHPDEGDNLSLEQVKAIESYPQGLTTTISKDSGNTFLGTFWVKTENMQPKEMASYVPNPNLEKLIARLVRDEPQKYVKSLEAPPRGLISPRTR